MPQNSRLYDEVNIVRLLLLSAWMTERVSFHYIPLDLAPDWEVAAAAR